VRRQTDRLVLITNTDAVYRGFDCRDPDALAPTPLPPLFLEDPAEGEHTMNISATEDTPVSDRRSSPVLPSRSTEHTTKSLGSHKLSRSPAGYNSASDFTNATAVTVLKEDSENTDKTPETASSPRSQRSGSSPSKVVTPKKDKQEPGDSPLSDCPSDLSDWDENKVRLES
jgi:hypothetical protein